jgi:pyrimidine operon attenuation protein/uracil phosphoribosyltransferase
VTRERIALGAGEVQAAIRRIAAEILERAGAAGARPADLAIIGVRRGGMQLAERLRGLIGQAAGVSPPLGTLDIALYRDDLSERGSAPVVGPTDVRFPIQGRTIVLVDDVLYTGRTIRAALDELVDFGRPRRVWLAVLVDRGGRELPIAPDFAGARVQAGDGDDVQVRLAGEGGEGDAVVVRPRKP